MYLAEFVGFRALCSHATCTRVLAQVELDFNSVERIVEYLEVPQEAPAVVQDKRPPAAWPTSDGELIVQDLVVKYAPHLPAVLKGLSFHVRPTEKIAVVRAVHFIWVRSERTDM